MAPFDIHHQSVLCAGAELSVEELTFTELETAVALRVRAQLGMEWLALQPTSTGHSAAPL